MRLTRRKVPPIVSVGEAWRAAMRFREQATGEAQRLAWRVDLLSDVGTPDTHDNPNGFTDCRMYDLVERVSDHLRTQHPLPDGEPWAGDNAECLAVIVRCYHRETYDWRRVTTDVPHRLDVAKIAQLPPPVGRWEIVSHSDVQALGAGLPLSYFLDVIPF